METVPGGSRIPTISTGFRRIPLEFLWNWKPEWLRLQPTSFRRNSMEFRHSTWNPPELMGDGKDLPSTHSKRQGHVNRNKKRQLERVLQKEGNARRVENYKARPNIRKNHISDAVPLKTKFDSTKLSIASTGYVGIRGDGSTTLYTVDQLVGPHSRFQFDYVSWTGETSIPIGDHKQRIIMGVAEAAAEAWEAARPHFKLSKKDRRHRRGKYLTRNMGILHGGGQTQPGILQQDPSEVELMESLRKHEAFVRLAGHQSGKQRSSPFKHFHSASELIAILSTWAPRLHKYYANPLQVLLDHNDQLQQNFDSSVFASCCFNLGPQTKGGHLVLWDLWLVIEFPARSTILVPSAAVTHSNTPIQPGERRYSFTQFTAGGLIRWVDYGFQKKEVYLDGLLEEERNTEELKASEQLSMGLSPLQSPILGYL
ncbi:uncharacterized protein LACBIDRAFT_329780 [Laccaria bicolor S238N-H82]|uniref:Predicted protein n=1 Tax=Laccaria bicolor (strain S238N-H82 / ATCC MYA-4686) TaxID=486041 RepID=B0DJ79_LACBS|nr:uncharacterized protein LACBIDRAFT_329780 [Laccaria bicolor S238N-H82]EDR05474.1 predicted protein [Laccaria bicolor S238N-H82]|eukprot:XP_001884032.1 predicted protein [Laccaria bicolor S238N-H82]